MAVWNIVKISKIDIKDRIDAEYFQPKFLEVATRLHHKENCPSLGEICKITASAFYPAATQLYSVGEIPFIRCVDVINYPVISDIQMDVFEKLPRDFLKKHKNVKILRSGDIVITKVGTPCYASIIDASLKEVALSRTVLGLRNISINPYYLIAFLRSKYGFYQLMRERELIIQLQLTLDRVKKIKVFIPKSKKAIQDISQSIKEHFFALRLSIMKGAQAEQMLSEELGIKDLDLSHKLFYTVNLKDIKQSHRIDAEYYQLQYERVITHIRKNTTAKFLGELVAIKKGIEPGSNVYQDNGIPFVRVSNLTKYEINDNNQKYLSEELYNKFKTSYKPKIGEILLSKDATPGIAFVVREDKQMIISSGILRLKILDEINNEYLALVLNSFVVQCQMQKDAGGLIINHWRPDQIKNTVIPVLSEAKQQELATLVTQSHQARKQAKELLEEAKKKVEELIEEKTE